MTDNGYVIAYRRAWSHVIFRDLLDAAIWNYLYQNAAWQDLRAYANGTRVELKRGQIVVSMRDLAVQFCCSEVRVRRLINALSDDAMIATLATHRGTIITICNYDEYQSPENTADALKAKPKTRKRRTGDAPIYNDKETNEMNTTKEALGPLAPVWFDPLLWAAFQEMRVSKKDPLTPKAEELMIRRLDLLRQQGHDPTAVIEQSIRNGWKDVYPLKGDQNAKHPTGKPSTVDILREGTARARAAREQGSSGST
ncbi:hypothetical protein [Fimbriiglobus ruber]|uniref:hypothetical protein n=1 Tax=Fimbriiglobus ruber TaxID=1908690 RepID=UPI000B4B3C10|nr:hypothetical protein [Fimbriiglobus ruber]